MSEQVPSDELATPKTDAVARWLDNGYARCEAVDADFARAQERKIAELETQRELETALLASKQLQIAQLRDRVQGLEERVHDLERQ